MQAISAVHFWRLEQQVLFFKIPASWVIVPNTKLSATRLGVAKATSMNIEHMLYTSLATSSQYHR